MKFQSKKSMIKMMVVFGLTYLSLALPYVLAYQYMASLGLSATQQGMVMTAGAVLGLVLQFAFGFLCDRFASIKKFVLFGNVIMIISVWLFYTQTYNIFAFTVILGALWNAMFMNIEGMLDSWALEEDETCKNNYGVIRAFGSIGYIIGSFLVALIVNHWGYHAIGIFFVGTAIINSAFEVFTPDAQKAQKDNGEKLKISDVKGLIKNPNYVILVFCMFLAFSMVVGEIFCSAQKMNALGLDTAPTYTSLKASIAAFCELPLFFLGSVLVKKFGAIKMMVFALIVHMVRLVLTALCVSQVQLVGISCLQLFTYPCIMVSIKYIIDEEIPENLKSSGQQFAYAIYLTLAALVMPLFFGWLLDKIGLQGEIWFAAAITAIPIIALTLYGRKHPQKVS